ncbi:MAG: hypothetical protein AVDCRST_MAG02-4387, partial [uncultured Rubrobacteraceae bacterium]
DERGRHGRKRLSLGPEGHRRPRLSGAGLDQGARERPARARGPTHLLLPALILPLSHLPGRARGARARRPGSGGEAPDQRVRGLPAGRGRRAPRGLPRPDAARHGLRRPRLRHPNDAVDGLGGLDLHHQSGQPGLRTRGDAPVLEAARHLHPPGPRFHPPDGHPLARGLRGGDVYKDARRPLRVPAGRLGRGTLGGRLRGRDRRFKRPLLPRPRRPRAVQVDHAGGFRGDGPDVRRQHRAQLLRLQARQLRPGLRPARCGDRLHALALRHGAHGARGRRDQRRAGTPRRGQEGRRTGPQGRRRGRI